MSMDKQIIEALREDTLYGLLATKGHDINKNDLIRLAMELYYEITRNDDSQEMRNNIADELIDFGFEE